MRIVEVEHEVAIAPSEPNTDISQTATCHTRSATVTGRTAVGTTGFVLQQSKHWCFDGWNVWNVEAPNFQVLEAAWNAEWKGTIENYDYNYTHPNGYANYSFVQGHICFTVPSWGCTQNYYPYLENWANQNGGAVWNADSDTVWGD